ncbi:hypothetical protein [Paenibacillus sp. MBLB4367]
MNEQMRCMAFKRSITHANKGNGIRLSFSMHTVRQLQPPQSGSPQK